MEGSLPKGRNGGVMRKTSVVGWLTLIALLVARPVTAHHSAAMFDRD